jgi:hypothetical protein
LQSRRAESVMVVPRRRLIALTPLRGALSGTSSSRQEKHELSSLLCDWLKEMFSHCSWDINFITDTKVSSNTFVQLFGSNASDVIALCRHSSKGAWKLGSSTMKMVIGRRTLSLATQIDKPVECLSSLYRFTRAQSQLLMNNCARHSNRCADQEIGR